MSGPVERMTLTHLQIPFKESCRGVGGEATIKDAILVTVETSDGLGLGECSPTTAALCEASDTLEECWSDLADRIAPRLLGRSFATVEEISDLAVTWKSAHASAIAGAETACWDALGQARRAPLAEMLGASSDQLGLKVEAGLAVGLYPTVVEMLKAIENHLAEGYRRLKIEIEPGRDVELVHAVRQHFGDIPLMVDARGAYTIANLDVFRELDEFDLLMIEQPMADDDLTGSAALQAELATPICLDESASSLELVGEAIERAACRIVSLKIQRVGGLGPALAMHDLCYQHGIVCWVGTTPELGIGQAHGIHLAALGNCRYPTDIGPSVRWFIDDYVSPDLEMAAPGILSVPSRPGLGYQMDHAKVRRYQVRQSEFTTRTSG
ncbi:O-succinylbenzoate synthase [Singulisphaera sp. GP187]|uniref:o-succinylbenzoate synthase n=1 Tax=Singulisphaera sp. GP187 TaxID=1882752 RepID=UPI000927AFC2|nr:o-succinylbenzoate synthase [Singulisphaera sp. GP187]SIO34642.1 O-succinylbenzoate synthase [Singulisphaera sp. GP187]